MKGFSYKGFTLSEIIEDDFVFLRANNPEGAEIFSTGECFYEAYDALVEEIDFYFSLDLLEV